MASDTTGQQHNILKGYNMLLYFAGTMILYEPAEECIKDFWKEGILKKLPVYSSNPAFIKAASQLRESCTDISSCTIAMSEDFYRLFSSETMSLAPAYESLYKESYPDVTDFYESYGWMSKLRPEMKDDHLGVELLFLTILLEKYMVLDDDACRGEMSNEIRRFIDQHILSWVPQWHRRVQENSSTLSYKGISSLIYACVEDIHSILSGRNDLNCQPGHLRN
jgi:TorA maturation chaperone TorD